MPTLVYLAPTLNSVVLTVLALRTCYCVLNKSLVPPRLLSCVLIVVVRLTWLLVPLLLSAPLVLLLAPTVLASRVLLVPLPRLVLLPLLSCVSTVHV